MALRRAALLAVLAVGAVGGFASAVHEARTHRGDRRAAFERHVADVCLAAARGK